MVCLGSKKWLGLQRLVGGWFCLGERRLGRRWRARERGQEVAGWQGKVKLLLGC